MSHGSLQPRPHLLPQEHPLEEPTPSFPEPPSSPTWENQHHFQAPSLQIRTARGKPPRWSHFPPFGPLKDTGRRRTGTPRPPARSSQLKLSRCDRRTSRSRQGMRWKECCSQCARAGFLILTHGTNTTPEPPNPPHLHSPSRGAPAATQRGGNKNDPPTAGITLQNSAQGARGSASSCCPLHTHTLPSRDFPTSPGSSAAAAVEHLPVSPPPHQLGIGLHQNAGGGEEDTQIF